MGRTANSLQDARKKARERRIALDADRELRDRRIEDAAVEVFALIGERDEAEAAIVNANALIGEKLRSLAGEGLSPESVAQLVDLEVSEVRRLSRPPAAAEKSATVTTLPATGADGAERRVG
ncbi:MAG: uncharacterized protein JWM93_735 [Frankiales bacterium]|nr:uncharacterized protein [Frankiales bacterium]